jgi:hypothetical protein
VVELRDLHRADLAGVSALLRLLARHDRGPIAFGGAKRRREVAEADAPVARRVHEAHHRVDVVGREGEPEPGEPAPELAAREQPVLVDVERLERVERLQPAPREPRAHRRQHR